MKVRITPHKLCGEVKIVGSKSYAHRYIIAAAFLSDKKTAIYGITPSDDVSATINAVKALGAKVVKHENFYAVTPTKVIPKDAVIDVKSSASTLRFMIPVVAALSVNASFIVSDSLKKRPINGLIEALSAYDVTFDDYKVTGKLVSGNFTVDTNLTSQYVTGLMFAAAILEGESSIKLVGKKVSVNYIKMTAKVLNDFGFSVSKKDDVIKVVGGRKCFKNKKVVVEGDWSGAAPYLALSALSGGGITISGLSTDTLQPDGCFVDILKSAGATITEADGKITVEAKKPEPLNLDMSAMPDLFPVVAAMCAFSDGVSVFSGVRRLQTKECDRVAAVIAMLGAVGVKSDYDGQKLTVYGGNVSDFAEFESFSDHRIVMAEALIALQLKKPSVLNGVEALSKSYPRFLTEINRLGGGNCVEICRKKT